MSRHRELLGTLTIPNGGTDTPALSSLLSASQLRVLGGSIVSLEVTGPAALTAACTVQTVPVAGSTTWNAIIVEGATPALAAVTTVSIEVPAFADLRIHSAGAEGAARAFILVAQLEM